MESAGSGRSLFSMLKLWKKLSGASIGVDGKMRGQKMCKLKGGSVQSKQMYEECFCLHPGNRTRSP